MAKRFQAYIRWLRVDNPLTKNSIIRSSMEIVTLPHGPSHNETLYHSSGKNEL